MVIFMGNSKPSQRFVFGLNFVKFTFLKGRKIKSNPRWVVSFPLAWNRHVPQGYPTFHLVHLHCNKSWKLLSDNLGYVVHSHFVLSSRCSLHAAFAPLPHFISFLFLMQPLFSGALFPTLHPTVAPFIPPHPLQLTSYTCVSVLQFWATLASFAQLFVVTTAWILME